MVTWPLARSPNVTFVSFALSKRPICLPNTLRRKTRDATLFLHGISRAREMVEQGALTNPFGVSPPR